MAIARPVIAFALLKQCSEIMRTDLLGGIAILIRPLLNDLGGHRFSAEILSKRVADAYGIQIEPVVLEEFIPRFQEAGLVEIKSLSENANEVLFSSMSEQIDQLDDEKEFEEVFEEFVNFSNARLSNVGASIDKEKLINGLLSRITSLDFLSIQAKPMRRDSEKGTRLVIGPTAKSEQELDQKIGDEARIDVLVASYVTELTNSSPERLGLLSRVADGALGAELVFDLQAPKQVNDLSKVTIILDTPLALSLLDLSSSQNKEYIEQLVASIEKVGAKLAIFRHSIDEAEGVLSAIKNGMIYGDAYGPTAERMRTPNYRAFFETMIGKVALRLTEQKGFEVMPPSATHYYQNFTQEEEEKLTARLHFSLLDKRLARERDALSVAETMRRRGGAHVPNHRIDSCKYLFITSNSSLQRQARSFLLSEKLLETDEFPPVVTDRYFSGLLWLLFGGKSGQNLSTARLLVNCANALRSRPDVVQRTKRFLSALDPAKAEHFEALMTNERAAQFMTQLTLGDAILVTEENAGRIYDQIEAIAGEKAAKERDEFYGKQLQELGNQLATTESLLQITRSELTQTVLDRNANQEALQSIKSNLMGLEESLKNQQSLSKEQIINIESFKTLLEDSKKVRETQESQLKIIRENQISAAGRHSARKISALRWSGVALILIIGGITGYIDKFVTPIAATDQQRFWNVVVISLQVLIAFLTLSAAVELLFGKIFKRVKFTAFSRYLDDLGWEMEKIKTAYEARENNSPNQ